jgi:hypothetical protein
MPKMQFETAIVKNLANHIVTLRSGDGDSTDIMPKSEVRIMRKFLLWQPPSPSVIRVISEKLFEKESVVTESNVEKSEEDK